MKENTTASNPVLACYLLAPYERFSIKLGLLYSPSLPLHQYHRWISSFFR